MRRLLIMALTLVCFGAAASAEEITVGYDGSFWNSLGKVGSEELRIPPGLSARNEALVKGVLDRERKQSREFASLTKKVLVEGIYEGVIFGCADLV